MIGYSSPPKNSFIFFKVSSCAFFFLFEGGSRVMGKRVMHCSFLCTVHVNAHQPTLIQLKLVVLQSTQRPLLLLELHVSTEG